MESAERAGWGLTADYAEPCPAPRFEPVEWRLAMADLIERMEPDDQMLFVCHVLWGYTLVEICEVTGIKKTTMSWRLKRAVKRARALWPTL